MKRKNDEIFKYTFLFAVFFVSIIIGRLLWLEITLPYHNPWSTTGPLSSFRFNPANNIVRFIVFIFLPLLLLTVVYVINFRGLNSLLFRKSNYVTENQTIISPPLPKPSRILFPIIFICFTFLFALNLPTFHIINKFDPFHEGESLGPAISYLDGKIPYKDYIFCHGLFQDPLRSIVAFEFFGRSIGSVRGFESIIKVISIIILSLVILKMYNRNYLFSFATILIISLLHLNTMKFYPDFHINFFKIFHALPDKFIRLIPRDIATILFFIPLLYFNDTINEKRISNFLFSIITFLFSFIAFASMGYSIDQGFYLITTWAILSPLLYFFFFRRSKYRNVFIIFNLIGIIAAVILFGFMLRWNFTEFFRYTFVILPKYKELEDGDIYPIYHVKFFLVLVVIAGIVFWTLYKFLQELKENNNNIINSVSSFGKKYFLEFSFLLLAIFFFRTALGRADQEHIAYSSWMVYFLLLFILFKHYFYKFSSYKNLTYLLVGVAILVGSLFLYRIHKKDLITLNFPFKVEDSKFIPKNYKATISFLKNNLGKDEDFYTMTSEASWFYFINKPCPTRFPVVYFASPTIYQKEVVDDLKKSNVKYILYRNKFWSNTIDHFSIESRHPIIVSYIKKNYVFYRYIDDNEIWINKKFTDQNEIGSTMNK